MDAECTRRARHAIRKQLALLALCVLIGCTACAKFTRPEGDGGWTREQRERELAERAAAAGVAVGPPLEDKQPLPPPTATAPLDLHAALALAASGNRRIAEAGKQVEAARKRFLDTRGRLLPNTLGTARYTWYSDPQTAHVSLPPALLQSGAAPPEVKIRDADAGTVNGTLILPLDLSGELRHLLSAAQAGYRGEQARLWATTLNQQAQVVRAYYDVLVVQVALQNAQQQLVQRNLLIDQARWTLNQAIGIEVNAPTQLVDVHARPDVPPPAAALQLAYQHNPVLLGLLEEQQALEENVRALESSRFPRFAAGGAIDYTTSNLLLPQRIESGFTGFTWDLGTDTRREAQIAEARVAADRNRVAIEAQMREIEAAVRSAQSAAEERLSALVAAEAAVGQAEENLRIRQQQFDSGRAQSDDVLIAEALLSQQRATLASALYQAHTRRAELQQLIGLSLDDIAVDQR